MNFNFFCLLLPLWGLGGFSLFFGGGLIFAQDSTNFISNNNKNAKNSWQFGEMYGAGAKRIATDSTGALYITGYMTEELRFEDKLLKERDGKYFLAKFLPNSSLIWVFQLSSPIQKIIISKQNILIGGQFPQKINVKNQELTGKGDISIFFSLLDLKGNIKFLKSIEGEPECMFNNLTMSQNGDICIAGSFTQNVYFGQKTLKNSHSKNVFLAGYNQKGEHLWTNTIAGGNNMLTGIHLRGLQTDKNGDFVVLGMISGICLFMPKYFSLQSSHELYHGEGWMFNHDIFIAKYTQQGTLKWAKIVANNAEAQDLCSDAEGNHYVTGYFLGTNQKMGANFGISLFGNTKVKANILEKDAFETVFVYKISTMGQFMWVRKMEGKGNARGLKIIYNQKNDKLLVSGAFSNILVVSNEEKIKKSAESSVGMGENSQLSNEKSPEISVNTDGKVHIFLVTLSNSGKFSSIIQSQSKESNELADMACDYKGRMWFVGRFKQKMLFSGAELQTQGNSTNGFVIMNE